MPSGSSLVLDLKIAIIVAAALVIFYQWMHAGEICPLGHQEISQIDLKDIQLLQNPP
jgi:hypothetical protein